VYLLSNLISDERAEVQALAPPVESLLAETRAERDLLEHAEDGSVLASARKGKRDGALDVLVVEFGGVARATDKAAYGTLFPRHSPTKTARLALVDEVREMERILGELAALDGGHALRLEYEAPLTSALVTLKAAMADSAQADTALALGRSRMERFKLRLDQSRVEVHGKLLSILKDKGAADAFFRVSNKAPGAETETETETEEPPAGAEPPKAEPPQAEPPQAEPAPS
jgi:hypothetical protein